MQKVSQSLSRQHKAGIQPQAWVILSKPSMPQRMPQGGPGAHRLQEAAMVLGFWGLRDAAAFLPALRNGSGINVPDNLSLRHMPSQISPSSALPLASRLFLKLAEKLLRMG